MEERNDSAFELGSAASVDSGRGEGLPHDGLTNVGGDEQGDAGAKAVPLLKELVEEDDDEGGGNELNDEEEADAGADVRGLAVETGKDIYGGLAEGDDEGKYYDIGQKDIHVKIDCARAGQE